MRVLVVAGSAMTEPLDSLPLDPPELVILADSGADHVLTGDATLLSGHPWILVGDMDSVTPSARTRVEEAGGEVFVLEVAKDETDLEFGLRLAVERGADEIVVAGALGGPRLDHLLGGVALLTAPWLSGIKVRLVDSRHEVFLAAGEALIRGKEGDIVSLVPLTPEVKGVLTEGLAYPLEHETLLQGSTRGVSNMMTGPEARVHHGPGSLLVFHYREHPGAPSGAVSPVHGGTGAFLACQFSLYPLRQSSIDEAIRAGIEEATKVGAASGMSVRVQPLSTLLRGDREVVFAAMRAAFDAAERYGAAVMICALTPAAPSDEVLEDIQRNNIDAWKES